MITIQEALSRGTGHWRSFNCPVHDDNTPSARVNVLTGRWVCMVCNAKGAADKYEPPERLVIDRVRRLSAEQRYLPESILDLYDADGPGEYWLSRFTPEACKHFRLGYDTNKEKSVYPIRDSVGRVLGLVYRGLPGEQPKYRYPRGVNTSTLLWNYESVESKSVVVLVEGAPDVVALWEVGVPALGTYGARLLPAQQALLSRLEPSQVVLAYDQDSAGRRGAQEAVSALLDDGITARRAYWGGYKDAGEMPPDERQKIFRKILAGA